MSLNLNFTVMDQGNEYTQVYNEVDDEGALTQYEQEEYIIEIDGVEQILRVKEGTEPEAVLLTDEPGLQITQMHTQLSDGRDLITTVTRTIDEEGAEVEERVDEIVESEFIEIEQDSDDDQIVPNSDEIDAVIGVEMANHVTVELQSANYRPVDYQSSNQITLEAQSTNRKPADGYIIDAEGPMEEDDLDAMDAEKEQQIVEDDVITEEPETSEEAEQTEESTEAAFSPDSSNDRRSLRRHISYEEFQEQFTEYKPPKRYEKTQKETAADRVAPKTLIMGIEADNSKPTGSEEGLPSAGYDHLSPRSPRTSEIGEIIPEEMSQQPTRTQGSVIRRMDSDARPVNPDTLVRAEDKPDLEAELPAVGTSSNIKAKFQSMGGETAVQVDYSQPIRQTSTNSQKRNSLVGPLSPRSNGEVGEVSEVGDTDHKEPAFEGGEVENVPEVREDLVRESDRNDEEELPEAGIARNLMSRFKEMETHSIKIKQTEYKPSGVGRKPPISKSSVQRVPPTEVVNSENYQHTEQVQGGEYENQPEIRTDVVKESMRNDEEELPTVGLTRNLTSVFKGKEEQAKQAQNYKPSGVGHRSSRSASGSSTPTYRQSSRASSTEPHKEPEFEGGEVENVPEVRADVVRESDRNDQEELPEAGYARNLRERLEMQAGSKSDYKEHIPSGVGSKATPTPLGRTFSTPINQSVSSSRQQSISEDGEGSVYSEPQVEGGEFENEPVIRTDVIREEDKNDDEELPEQGMASNLLSKFKNMEVESANVKKSQYRPSGIGTKATPSKLNIMAGRSSYHATGLGTKDHIQISNNAEDSGIEQEPEAGEFENEPLKRTDVAREESTINEEEFPQEGSARGLMSKFSNLDKEQTTTVQHKPSGVGNKPTPTAFRPKTAGVISPPPSEVEDSIDSANRSEYESTPVVNAEVVRETDNNENGLPTAGAAKNLTQRFRELENKKSNHVDHKPSKIASQSTPTPLTLKR